MRNSGLYKTGIVLFLFILCVALTAQESDGLRFGVQMSSDSFAGLLLYSGPVEASARVQLVQTDTGDTLNDILIIGGHAALLLRPFGDATSLSLGAELRNGLSTGDAEYAEYVDAGVRLGVNYSLGDHLLLSGLLYPVFISTRETDGLDDWTLTATFAKTAVAVSFLF